MKFLVTGGAGFIGSHFVDFLLLDEKTQELVTKVIVLDKLTYAGNLANLNQVSGDDRYSFVKGDILDQQLLASILEDQMVIVNFAAESHVDNSINNPMDFFKTNILGTSTLLEACKYFKGIRFIQVSTDEVYGSIASGSWTESSHLEPNSPYSASKASADLICRSYFKTFGINLTITRCSNNFGPRQNPEKLIPKIVLNLFTGGKIPVYGDGTNIRDWLYVADHVQGIWKSIFNGRSGEIYNIGGGIELSNLDLISLIFSRVNQSFETRWQDSVEFVQDRKAHDHRYSLDFSKAMLDLTYKPSKDFETHMNTTIEYYKKSFQNLDQESESL